jgi:hypothetical protein
MSLFHTSRRPDKPAQPVALPLDEYTALVRRLGRLEAEVESLGLQWIGYRDELKRLANRLERRDQRAQERERAEAEGSDSSPGNGGAPDEISQFVLLRRNRHGLRNQSPEG